MYLYSLLPSNRFVIVFVEGAWWFSSVAFHWSRRISWLSYTLAMNRGNGWSEWHLWIRNWKTHWRFFLETANFCENLLQIYSHKSVSICFLVHLLDFEFIAKTKHLYQDTFFHNVASVSTLEVDWIFLHQ